MSKTEFTRAAEMDDQEIGWDIDRFRRHRIKFSVDSGDLPFFGLRYGQEIIILQNKLDFRWLHVFFLNDPFKAYGNVAGYIVCRALKEGDSVSKPTSVVEDAALAHTNSNQQISECYKERLRFMDSQRR